MPEVGRIAKSVTEKNNEAEPWGMQQKDHEALKDERRGFLLHGAKPAGTARLHYRREPGRSGSKDNNEKPDMGPEGNLLI